MIRPDPGPFGGRLARALGRWRGRALVVAVSGGGDSVGLLRAMHGLASGLDLTLSVAHLDHGVRGEGARLDARFVADLAAGLDLPFDEGHWRPTRPGHFEADARRARYAWLAEVARDRGAAAVAVGQTLDDQAETVLHRIVRGTGVEGLAGIRPTRRLAPGVSLIRPLLRFRRAEVRDYLATLGQPFRDDPSNADTARTRARIRHQLLPGLAESYNPRVAEALARLGALASAASRSLARRTRALARTVVIEATAGGVVLDRTRLARLGPFERAEVIRLAWRQAGWPEREMDGRRWRRLARLADAGPRRLAVGLGIEAEVFGDRLILGPARPTLAPWPSVALDLPGSVAWGPWRITATLDGSAPGDERIDLDRVEAPLIVRAAEAGDRFDPLGLGGRTRPLADFFRGRRVPRLDRASVPIVADRRGIVWVAGHRIADRVRLTDATARTLGLRLDPAPPLDRDPRLRTNGRAIFEDMAPQAAKSRERILHQGLALMSRAGLGGVTIGILAEQVGMSKSGVFAHFRSKDDVQIGLLDHMAEFAGSFVIEPALAEPEGLPRLEALVRNWLGWAGRAGLPGGCPVAAGMFELDDVEGPVRDKVAAMEAVWRGLLSSLVARSVELGHLNAGLDVDQFVWELCGIYLSHHAAQRFLRQPDADARAWTAFRALLDRARRVD